jgi:hypothetical protein
MFPLIYKEIPKGSVAKSYKTNGLLIYGYSKYIRISLYARKPFLIYDFAPDLTGLSFFTVYEKNFVFFFISVTGRVMLSSDAEQSKFRQQHK